MTGQVDAGQSLKHYQLIGLGVYGVLAVASAVAWAVTRHPMFAFGAIYLICDVVQSILELKGMPGLGLPMRAFQFGLSIFALLLVFGWTTTSAIAAGVAACCALAVAITAINRKLRGGGAA